MKTIIRTILLLAVMCLYPLLNADPPQAAKGPPLTLEEALAVAKQYLQEHKLSVANLYIESAVLLTNPAELTNNVMGNNHDRIRRPKGIPDAAPLWRIKWVPVDRFELYQPRAVTNQVKNGEVRELGSGRVFTTGGLWLFIFMNRAVVMCGY